MKHEPSPQRSRAERIRIVLLALIFTGLAVSGVQRGFQRGGGTFLATGAHAETAPAVESGLPNLPVEPAAADPATTESAETGGGTMVFQRDPLESLAQSLKERERALDAREQAVKDEEKRLEALRAEVEQKLARSEQVLKEMEKLAGQAAAERDKELSKWIRIYQSMPAQDAGRMMAGLETDFARELLAKMEPKKAAKILAAFPREKAVELGQQLNRQ